MPGHDTRALASLVHIVHRGNVNEVDFEVIDVNARE